MTTKRKQLRRFAQEQPVPSVLVETPTTPQQRANWLALDRLMAVTTWGCRSCGKRFDQAGLACCCKLCGAVGCIQLTGNALSNPDRELFYERERQR